MREEEQRKAPFGITAVCTYSEKPSSSTNCELDQPFQRDNFQEKEVEAVAPTEKILTDY